jgi:YD repeat-containing protein
VRGPGCASCGPTNRRYGYDQRGRLVEQTTLDERGRPVRALLHQLDPLGRPVRESRVVYEGGKAGPPQWTVRYGYASPAHGQPSVIVRPSVVPGREHRVRIERNAHGQPVAVTEEGYSPLDEGLQPAEAGAPLRRTTTYRYDRINDRSLLTQVDGPLPNGPSGAPLDSDITRLEYDANGHRVSAVTHPGGLRSTFRHDAAGRLSEHVPPDGIPIRQALDAQGRVVQWQQGAIRATLHHDALGQLQRIERNDGTRYTVHRDAGGRVVAVSDAQGYRQEVRLDTESRVLETLWRDPDGTVPFEPQRREYDAMGRVVAESGGLRVRYDDQGRIQATEDALKRRSRHHYDSLGRLVEHEIELPAEPSWNLLKTALQADAQSVRTKWLYSDGAHEASGIVAPNGARTTSDLDDFGRTVRLDSPDTGVEVRRHDAADRLVERTDAAGNRTTLDHDAAGRVIRRRITNPARPGEVDEARWRYQGALLVEVSNAQQSDTYRWDAQHRLVEQVTRLTGWTANCRRTSSSPGSRTTSWGA